MQHPHESHVQEIEPQTHPNSTSGKLQTIERQGKRGKCVTLEITWCCSWKGTTHTAQDHGCGTELIINHKLGKQEEMGAAMEHNCDCCGGVTVWEIIKLKVLAISTKKK